MATAMPWKARVLTLYPAMFPGPLGQSLADGPWVRAGGR